MLGALGRVVEHDPRSLAFPAPRAPALVTVLHHRHTQAYDQGDLGSCTGNAMAGALMTDPLWVTGRRLSERSAIKFYKYATVVDDTPGSYPPDDTGSSGIAVAKAAQHYGYVRSYTHAFGLQHALEALVLVPVIVGVNWYEGFDEPGPGGVVTISGSVRGGHEVELQGVDVDAQTVRAVNSWGPTWGDKGRFTVSWGDLDRLLSEDGDVTVVVT